MRISDWSSDVCASDLRQEHDIAGSEAGHRHCADEFRERTIIPPWTGLGEMRPITDRRERLDDRRRRAGLPPTDADVLGREIDPRLDHAVDPGKRVPDGPDATAQADPRHGELALPQALPTRPPRNPGFLPLTAQAT